jgi:hypothetical protein
MNKRAALDASIKHWEENVAAETSDQASIPYRHCALCTKFDSDEETEATRCTRCPVYRRTKRQLCEGTPYKAAWDALEAWCFAGDKNAAARSAWMAAAQAELDFLISLRAPVTP